MNDGADAITPEAIERTALRIAPYIRATPVLEIRPDDLGIRAGALFLKLELLQYGGSFKARGAFANLLTRKLPVAGVVAASGGNHGVAVALAAKRLGVPARIFVPTVSSPAKVERIRALGAALVITGDRYADALAASESWAAESGALPVHAFDQQETLLGQGTLAREFDRQAAPFDTILASVGGGGLIGGIAAWFGRRPGRNVKVIGVEPETAPTLAYALKAGAPVDAPAGGIAADSLAPKRIGDIVFPIAARFVDASVLVPDAEIARAQRELWAATRVAAEPGGVAALAALISGRYRPAEEERVGVVISGGNTTAVTFP
ncbi:MAG: threonine/serine dehydratase [Thermoplasmatota archaeon]